MFTIMISKATTFFLDHKESLVDLDDELSTFLLRKLFCNGENKVQEEDVNHDFLGDLVTLQIQHYKLHHSRSFFVKDSYIGCGLHIIGVEGKQNIILLDTDSQEIKIDLYALSDVILKDIIKFFSCKSNMELKEQSELSE
jgi:hypothetical protein